MFDLYQAPATADYRQADLYAEIAADRLARSASEGDQTSSDERQSPARRLIIVLSDAMAAIGGAINVPSRHPHVG